MGIVACGVQGRSNLEALSCLFEIRRVKAFDVRPEAATATVKTMDSGLVDRAFNFIATAA